MMDILNWCLAHYEMVLAILSFCVSLVLFIVRKKPIILKDTFKSLICSWLPACIIKAEGTGLKGEKKVAFVLTTIKDLIFPDDIEAFNRYERFIRSQIEAILSTPQKKL